MSIVILEVLIISINSCAQVIHSSETQMTGTSFLYLHEPPEYGHSGDVIKDLFVTLHGIYYFKTHLKVWLSSLYSEYSGNSFFNRWHVSVYAIALPNEQFVCSGFKEKVSEA